MPELPEVETVRRDLQAVLPGDQITRLTVFVPKMLRPDSQSSASAKIIGRRITDVRRRAKLLIIDFDNSRHLVIHLKMTGQLLWRPAKGQKVIAGGHTDNPADQIEAPGKHTRAELQLQSGAVLYFNDLRRFGYLEIMDDKRLVQFERRYGPEPLPELWRWSDLAAVLQRRPRSSVKALLLDQAVVAGLGNIYVDEACFRAGVRPDRRVSEVSAAAWRRLWRVIPVLLQEAVAARGTTFNNYRDGRGRRGLFAAKLRVYGRKDQPCQKCGTAIIKIKTAGRGTHYCPCCQK